MNKDRLLGELGDLARREGEAEKDRLDERWDRLAAGVLTGEEEAELKALAATSPEARGAYEAFRPLGADFQARMVSAIQAPRPEPPETRFRFLPFRRVARRAEIWVGLTAAVAAGAFFLVRTPVPLPPLPGYELVSLEVSSDYRGSGSPTAAPGSPVTLTVSPRTAVAGEVEARGFLSCAGEGLHPWRSPSSVRVIGKGTVIFSSTLPEAAPPGPCAIWIVVARKGKAPENLLSELRTGRTEGGDWQAVPATLEVHRPQ